MSVLFLSPTITCTNTHTHTVRHKHMEMKSSGRRRGLQRPWTHTHSHKTHTRTLLICIFQCCPLTYACTCLCSTACSSPCRPPCEQPKNTQFLAGETCRASKQDRQKTACHTAPTPCVCFAYSMRVHRYYQTCVFVHHWCQKPKHPGFIRVSGRHPRLWPLPPPFISQLWACVCVWSHQIVSLVFYRSGFIVIHLPDNMLIQPAQPFGLYFTQTTPALQPKENIKKKKMKNKIKCHSFCKHWSCPGLASSEFALMSLGRFLYPNQPIGLWWQRWSYASLNYGGRRCKTSTRNKFKKANTENMWWHASVR